MDSMIGYLVGIVKKYDENRVIILCNGVGYEVFWAGGELREGDKLEAWIYEHRTEREVRLFGFRKKEDKKLFIKLLEVKGVGPVIAYGIVKEMGVSGVIKAISENDFNALAEVNGVGKKLGIRIVNEMKDLGAVSLIGLDQEKKEEKVEIISALINLGYDRRDAKKAVEEIERQGGDLKNYSLAIKKAIKMIKSINKR